MKKLILILIVLVVFKANAQDNLQVNGFVETGYLKESMVTNENTVLQAVDYPNAFYTDILFDFSIKGFHMEQQIYNIFTYPGSGYTFKPHEIRFITRLYYTHKAFTIGVDHMCLHPIIVNHNDDPVVTRRGNHDKIFIRYTFNLNVN